MKGYWKCSCGMWEEHGLTCRHIFAVTGRQPGPGDYDLWWSSTYLLHYSEESDGFEQLKKNPKAGPTARVSEITPQTSWNSESEDWFTCTLDHSIPHATKAAPSPPAESTDSPWCLTDDSPLAPGSLTAERGLSLQQSAERGEEPSPAKEMAAQRSMEQFQAVMNIASPGTIEEMNKMVAEMHAKALAKQQGISRMQQEIDDGKVAALPIDGRKRSARRELSWAEGRKKP